MGMDTVIRARLGLIVLGTTFALQGCCSCCVDTGRPVWDFHCATPMPNCHPTWYQCGPYVPHWCDNAYLPAYTQQTVGHHFYTGK